MTGEKIASHKERGYNFYEESPNDLEIFSCELSTMRQKRTPKVLISAYACEPNKGSEPGVGWNWAKQIAKFAEVWVITRANNRYVIEEELKKDPVASLNFIYYDVPMWISFWKKKTKGLYLYYLLWQIGAYRLAKKTNKEEKFNVAHHLTFGNIWLPTFIPFLNLPFIWGPLGGVEQVIKRFRKEYSLRSKIKELSRDFIISTLGINLIFKYACSRASFIITKTRDAANKIPLKYNDKVLVLTDVGVNFVAINPVDKFSQEHIQLIAVGKLDAWRGFDLLVRALQKVNKEYANVFLIIVGDGVEMRNLEKARDKLNLSEKIIFTKQIDKEMYWELMRKSTIFVNPCLKEGGVTVLFNALSLGLPIICFDIAGASEIINDECGIKIKPITPEQTIQDLADAIVKLARDPELRKKLGEAGRKMALEVYSWEKKGEVIKQIYEKLFHESNK